MHPNYGSQTSDFPTEHLLPFAAARPVVKKQSRRSSVRTTRKVSVRESVYERLERPRKGTELTRRGPSLQGKLSGLLRLPAELITTICQHLDLETLFHVSRLNKYLWRLLRQTTSLEYLWERARIESGLPELTAAGMNVFEYANLVFGCCQVRLVHRPPCCAISVADVLNSYRAAVLRHPRLSIFCAPAIALLAPRLRELSFRLIRQRQPRLTASCRICNAKDRFYQVSFCVSMIMPASDRAYLLSAEYRRSVMTPRRAQ